MAYTTIQRVSDYLKRDLTDHEVNLFPVLLKSATSFIDDYTDTSFEDVEEPFYRYYDGGYNEIDIDPCKDIESVTVVSSDSITNDYSDSDYVLEPINQTIKTSIRLKGGQRFPYGAANIRVEGKHTSFDEAIPADIVLAATMLVADYLNGARDVVSESIEGWSVTYGRGTDISATVKDILSGYRRNVL